MAKRTLVVGDIHGASQALIQALTRSDYDPKTDNIIFLGDYVDGWSESMEVVSLLIGMQQKHKDLKRNPDSIIFLEGNHDQWFKDFLNIGVPVEDWLANGGRSTLESYQKAMELSDDIQVLLGIHRKFFNYLQPYFVDNKNRAFVHAGCNRFDGVAGTLPYLRLWDRSMWAQVQSGGEVKAHSEVYIGHTTTTVNKLTKRRREFDIQKDGKNYITVPMNRQNVWNMDTGGGWDGKVTIMDIDTKEFWQSDFCFDLYPNELGRYKNKK